MPNDSRPESHKRLSFFFDNNFPKRLAAALAELCPEHNLEHLLKRFAPNTADETWINQLATEGNWIVVSGDYDLIAVPHVVKVIRANTLVGVVLKKGFTNLEIYECASKIIKVWPRIVECARYSKPGEIWTVGVSSLKVEKYEPPKF
jgi:hypothetical protein